MKSFMRTFKVLWNGFDKESARWLNNLKEETLSGMLEDEPITATEADVIVLNWKKDGQEHYMDQQDLLESALMLGTPVLIFDQQGGHEENPVEILDDPRIELDMFNKSGVPMKLTMPAFFPLQDFDTLHIPYPFQRGRHKPFHTNRLYKRSYVGHSDERYGQALEWFREIEGDLWGDWLEGSHEQTLIDFGVGPRFHDVCPVDQVQTVYRRSIATVHLGTGQQMELGMLTLRYAEAAEAGCLAFTPWEMNLPPYWRTCFTSEEDIWKSNLEDDTNHTQKYLLSEMQNQQQLLIQEAMSHYAWAKVIGDLCNE